MNCRGVCLYNKDRLLEKACFVPGKKKAPAQQTEPPTVPVWDLFPDKIFPEGERQSYKDEYVLPASPSWS